jgi:hypothetical protein
MVDQCAGCNVEMYLYCRQCDSVVVNTGAVRNFCKSSFFLRVCVDISARTVGKCSNFVGFLSQKQPEENSKGENSKETDTNPDALKADTLNETPTADAPIPKLESHWQNALISVQNPDMIWIVLDVSCECDVTHRQQRRLTWKDFQALRAEIQEINDQKADAFDKLDAEREAGDHQDLEDLGFDETDPVNE